MLLMITASVILFLLITLVMVFVLLRARNRQGRTAPITPGALATPLQASRSARNYPVRSPAMRTRTALIICLALVLDIAISGGVAAYFQRENIRQAELLQAEGIVTRAEVVALDIEEDDDGDETYYVTYTFFSRPDRPEEREVTLRDSIPYELYSALEQGGRIEVIYAPSDPEVARIMADYELGSVSYAPAIIGAVVILPSLGALLWFYSCYRRAARLEEEGVAATAEVLEMYEDSSGDSTSYHIVCQLPGGGPVRISVSSSLYRQLRVGSRVMVRYLSEDPGVFRVEGA